MGGVLFGLTDQLLRGGFKSWHPEFLFKGRVRASERDLVSRYNLEIPPVLETRELLYLCVLTQSICRKHWALFIILIGTILLE